VIKTANKIVNLLLIVFDDICHIVVAADGLEVVATDGLGFVAADGLAVVDVDELEVVDSDGLGSFSTIFLIQSK